MKSSTLWTFTVLTGLLLLFGWFCGPASTASNDASNATFRGDSGHTGISGSRATVRDRELQWRASLGGTVRSTPAVAGQTVFVGSGDGALQALDARSGAVRWRFATEGAVSSSPAVADGLVFFTSRDRSLYALTADGGALRWRFKMGEDLPFKWGWDYYLSSPVVADGRVYAGSGDGHLYAVDARTGKEIWRFRTGGRVSSSPAVSAVSGSRVLVGSQDGSLYSVSADTGKLAWKFDTEGVALDSAKFGYDRTSIQSSPAVARGTVVFGGRDGNVYAVDEQSGSQKWRFSHEGSWIVGSAALLDDLVLVGSSDGLFFQAIDLATGKEVWRVETDSNVFSSGTVADGNVYFTTKNGSLYVLEARTGKEQWRLRVGGSLYSSPVLADGAVYFGSDDGTLYAVAARPAADPGRPAAKRAVFWNEKAVYRWFQGDIQVRDHLVAAGYQLLQTADLDGFLRDRATDHAPSVVVFASDVLPETVASPGGDAPLLRRYLETGGKVVWLGVAPLLYDYDQKTGKRGPVTRERTARLLGIDYEWVRREEFGVRVTEEGTRWGLRNGWVGLMAVDPGAVTTVLAYDEIGRAAAWVKRYGGAEGTGFVRLWGRQEPCTDLLSVQLAAEHGLR